jgi:pimeloyl-ACP methyl ester carboxylesterase
MTEATGTLHRAGNELAWAHLPGRAPTPHSSPTIVFLPGFKSDMEGSKATHLRDWAASQGRAMLRLDYSGHGQSTGAFEAGTIGSWTEDARAIIEARTTGSLLLVGSSMGGWIALLLARAMPARIAALVGIAAAPDFTETLLWASLTDAERATLQSSGHIERPSLYGEQPYRFTRALIEDGRAQSLLHAPIPVRCPVRLLQGQQDPDVPWQTALRIAEQLDSTDVEITLIKDGDHRLSRPQDLDLLARTVGALPR